MSIPLDQLYNFLYELCNRDVIIYRFLPPGSRNFDHCTPVLNQDLLESLEKPYALHHDQETIQIDFFPLIVNDWYYGKVQYKCGDNYPWFKTRTLAPQQFFNKLILVHSEKNSAAVVKLSQHGYIPVHWFSHAVIARDWFRYAKYDPKIKPCNHYTYKFLIYNRAWTGSREYRLYFASQLVEKRLLQDCNTSFSFETNNKHYSQHIFKNLSWKTDIVYENYFKKNIYRPEASADYDVNDYNTSAIEVVLETMFDTDAISLTEKIFRPIALSKPFILAAPAGSLKYLKSYGFESFSPFINEQYDNEIDPMQRMSMILKEMQRLQSLSNQSFQSILKECNHIAQRNRNRFFSPELFNQVINEYTTGMSNALDSCKKDVSDYHWNQWAKDQKNLLDLSSYLKKKFNLL